MSDNKTEPGTSKITTGLSSNVCIINRQLNVRPFEATLNRDETANRWEKWLQNVERQFQYFGITEPELRKDGLIIYGGQTLADLEQTLPEVPDEDGGDNVYTKLVNKLNKHFLLKKNKDFARFQFGNLKQESEESLVSYFTRVKDVARKCGFQNEDEVIRDHLIKTMINNGIRIKAMRRIGPSMKY